MHNRYPTIVTTNDYSRLQALKSSGMAGRGAFATLLHHKLAAPIVTLPSDIGPDLVTEGRCVRFRIDGVRSEERTLVWSPNDWSEGLTLSLLLPRGLALLGLSIGQSISFLSDDGGSHELVIEHVFDPDQTSGQQSDIPLAFPAAIGRAGIEARSPFRRAALEIHGASRSVQPRHRPVTPTPPQAADVFA